MEKRENGKEFKEIEANLYMGLSLWQRVLSGVAGGAFITGGIWLYSSLEPTQKLWAIIPIALGIFAIFYGRKG